MQHNRRLAHPPLLLHCQDRCQRHIYNVVKQKLRTTFQDAVKRTARRLIPNTVPQLP
ncbi:unnamed protein product [Ixodes persulcatus]